MPKDDKLFDKYMGLAFIGFGLGDLFYGAAKAIAGDPSSLQNRFVFDISAILAGAVTIGEAYKAEEP